MKNIVDEKQVGIKEVIKIIYLKRRHIFKIFNIYLKPDRFRKSKFTLSKVKSEKKDSDFTFDNVNFDLRKRSGFKYITTFKYILFLTKSFLVVHNVFIR